MIHCATHDGYDKPPCVPMFSGSESKRSKRESLSDVVADGAAAVCKALSSQQPQPPQSASSSGLAIGVSPSKSVDLRMKNLQQLCYTQQLFEDNILIEEEYTDQKQNILDSLRKLS